MEIYNIKKSKLYGDDCIITISMLYTKEDLEKMNLNTEEEINDYIKDRLQWEE
jgi:hypothetical protein